MYVAELAFPEFINFDFVFVFSCAYLLNIRKLYFSQGQMCDLRVRYNDFTKTCRARTNIETSRMLSLDINTLK